MNDCKYRTKILGFPAKCFYYNSRICIDFNGHYFYTDEDIECNDCECPIKHPKLLDNKPTVCMIDQF